MGTSPGSLASAVAGADRRVTVLDDRIDAEDHAEWLWLRAHVLHGFAGHRVVVGTEALTTAWKAKTIRFPTQAAAVLYLRHFAKDRLAMQSLRKLAAAAGTGALPPRADDDVLTAVSASLLLGRAWLLELPKRAPKSRFVTKTNPDAFAPINPRLGTKVDFTFIASLEGDQWLRGYVPIRKNLVVGKSGMTLASGFDVGQWQEKDLQRLTLPKTIVDKIKPFLAPNNFKGLTRLQVAEKVGKLGPVPELQKAEADQCDSAVFSDELITAARVWDHRLSAGVPTFTDLPGAWQTVWLSRVYQGKREPFGHLARSGNWQGAILALRQDTQYPERTSREADLLMTELPPPVIAPQTGSTK